METVEYVVGENGEKKAIILPIEDYEGLIEEIHDLKVIAERKGEEDISLADFKKRLKKDGVLG